ncbi:Deoxycytidine kinase 1 [Cystobasidiomycetes sp. EMM_F5]
MHHFASVITELGHCFAESEVLDLAVSFCDSIDATRLSTGVQRVLLLTQLAGGPLLDSASARSAFVPNSVRWLKPHLSSYNELGLLSPREGEGADDATRISWLEGVRLSVSVIAILLDRLHAGLVNAAHKDDKASAIHDQDAIIFLLSLMPRLLSATEEIRSPPNLQAIQRYRSTSTLIATTPTVFPATSLSPLLVKSALASNAASTNLDHLVGEVAANIIALIHIALPSTLLTLFEDIIEVDGPLKCRSIVIQLLRLFTSITRGEIFPPTWLNIFALALRCGVRAAQAISAVIIRHYLPTRTQSSLFDNTLWKEYFGTLLTLLHSPLLAIEDFGSARQRIIWRLCGDLRGRGATILLRTWQSLSWASNDTAEAKMLYGGYQVGMTSLVEPVLGLCLSHHDELRNSAVNILFSLIISEY